MKPRLVYGIQAVGHVLRRPGDQVEAVYLDETIGRRRLERINSLLGSGRVTVHRVPTARLDELTGTSKHQGVAAMVHIAPVLNEEQALAMLAGVDNPLVVLLDGVQDPRNFGSILRTANGAGADLVVVGRSRNVAITPVVSKVAAGAAELQPVAEVANLARFMSALKQTGLWLIGTAEKAEQGLFDADLCGSVAVVLGAEGQGLRRLTRERCDFVVSVPMCGEVDSLNVAVWAGVVLYEAVRQRRERLAPDTGLR